MAKGLTRRHELFVAEYLTDLNATRAAIVGGYSKKGAEQTGSVLLRNPKVSAEIEQKQQKRLGKLEITAKKTLAELAKIAFFDSRRMFEPDGRLKQIHELDDDTAAVVAAFEVVELAKGSGRPFGYSKKVKLADKLRALELLGKHLKLFTEKIEHSGRLTLERLVCGDAGGEE